MDVMTLLANTTSHSSGFVRKRKRTEGFQEYEPVCEVKREPSQAFRPVHPTDSKAAPRRACAISKKLWFKKLEPYKCPGSCERVLGPSSKFLLAFDGRRRAPACHECDLKEFKIYSKHCADGIPRCRVWCGRCQVYSYYREDEEIPVKCPVVKKGSNKCQRGFCTSCKAYNIPQRSQARTQHFRDPSDPGDGPCELMKVPTTPKQLFEHQPYTTDKKRGAADDINPQTKRRKRDPHDKRSAPRISLAPLMEAFAAAEQDRKWGVTESSHSAAVNLAAALPPRVRAEFAALLPPTHPAHPNQKQQSGQQYHSQGHYQSQPPPAQLSQQPLLLNQHRQLQDVSKQYMPKQPQFQQPTPQSQPHPQQQAPTITTGMVIGGTIPPHALHDANSAAMQTTGNGTCGPVTSVPFLCDGVYGAETQMHAPSLLIPSPAPPSSAPVSTSSQSLVVDTKEDTKTQSSLIDAPASSSTPTTPLMFDDPPPSEMLPGFSITALPELSLPGSLPSLLNTHEGSHNHLPLLWSSGYGGGNDYPSAESAKASSSASSPPPQTSLDHVFDMVAH